ncbi:hypothetical protein ACKWTF_001492 [Chironomus riparius]
MGIKNVFILLITLTILTSSFCQREFIGCNYFHTGLHYTCQLRLHNPNGLNNFVRIEGNHMFGMINEDVTQVYIFSDSNSTIIPAVICDTFRNVVSFMIQSLGVREVDRFAFRNCRQLRTLDFQEHSLHDENFIEERAFQENTELIHLTLLGLQFTTLPEGLFVYPSKLELLHLEGNRFSNLPQNIFAPLTNLKILAFGSNNLKVIRTELINMLVNLEVIYLNLNHIQELPMNLFSTMRNLRTISLGHNMLTVIHSESFGFLPNLTELFLTNNQINAFDEKLLYDTELTDVRMTGNICANEDFRDTSESRDILRTGLQRCFENYKYY